MFGRIVGNLRTYVPNIFRQTSPHPRLLQRTERTRLLERAARAQDERVRADRADDLQAAAGCAGKPATPNGPAPAEFLIKTGKYRSRDAACRPKGRPRGLAPRRSAYSVPSGTAPRSEGPTYGRHRLAAQQAPLRLGSNEQTLA